MLTDDERDALLIRLDERTQQLITDMTLAKSQTGFARCQVHATEMQTIKDSAKWSRRVVGGGVLLMMLKGAWDYWTNGGTP